MSGGKACTCGQPPRDMLHLWQVTRRNYRNSAFDGYHPHWSNYSQLRCTMCGASWRTKAAYVKWVQDAPADWATIGTVT